MEVSLPSAVSETQHLRPPERRIRNKGCLLPVTGSFQHSGFLHVLV